MATAPVSGMFPTDFILQAIIETGLAWYRANPSVAGNAVFGQLNGPLLAARYGSAKITELTTFITTTNIPVVQHWSLVGKVLPCFSIQLMNGGEAENEAALGDLAEVYTTLDGNGLPLTRNSYAYSPIRETIQVGVHAATTPDYAKYLYYFFAYVMMAFKLTLEENGLELTTFEATDVSRLNEFLPENVFTRFVNVRMRTSPEFTPQVADQLITAIQGVQIAPIGNLVPVSINLAPGTE